MSEQRDAASADRQDPAPSPASGVEAVGESVNEPWSMADAYRSLRLLVEHDVSGGLTFALRAEAAAALPAATDRAPASKAPAARVGPRSASATAGPTCQAKPQSEPQPEPQSELQPPQPSLAPIIFPAGDASQRLAQVAAACAACQRCPLAAQRQQVVPGEGNSQPEFVFLGEAPGFEEDRSGRPFVGPAGQLLDKMIAAMGLSRGEVFILNTVKCRPPDNRNPSSEEVAACAPYLAEQLSALSPRVIITLGAVALRALLSDPKAGVIRHRGKALTWQSTPVVATFHPSYLLRNPVAKGDAWTDLKRALSLIDKVPPARSKG